MKSSVGSNFLPLVGVCARRQSSHSQGFLFCDQVDPGATTALNSVSRRGRVALDEQLLEKLFVQGCINHLSRRINHLSTCTNHLSTCTNRLGSFGKSNVLDVLHILVVLPLVLHDGINLLCTCTLLIELVAQPLLGQPPCNLDTNHSLAHT